VLVISLTIPDKLSDIVRVKYLEIIADNLSKAGGSWGCVATIDARGRTVWIADAHRGDGKRFVVRGDEKLCAFIELEQVLHAAESVLTAKTIFGSQSDCGEHWNESCNAM
jgi:hypothetical protein